jgi:hypothetical protein
MAGRDFALISGPLAPGGSAALAARVREAVAADVQAEAERIFTAADDRWPVRTGKSKAGLYMRDDSTATMIVIRIGNTVDYARFIKSAKLGAKPGPSFRPVLTRELGDPVRAARKTLPARAAELAAEALEAAG